MITFTANVRSASARSDDAITTSSVGIPVQLVLADEFMGLAKTLVFRAGATTVDVVLVGDATEAVVPPDVLTTVGLWLGIGIYAADGEGNVVIPTVWASAGLIQQGAVPSGVDPSEPTPSWVAQVQSIASEANENASDALSIAQGVKAQADAGDFDGADGQDGVSPTIAVTDITGGHRVSITDANGTQTFDVLNGENGTDGTDGTDGEDGYSPTVSVTEITGGHRVTITDANGAHTFDVMDGTGGGGGAVDSVNGQTGTVVLDAADVGALPDTTTIPTKTSQLQNDSGFLTSAPVTSVNGQTGAVSLSIPSSASDVGAIAAPSSPSSGDVLTYANGAWGASASPTEVAWFTYGTSTSAQIEAAYQAGKVCLVDYNTRIYVLTVRNSATSHRFSSAIHSNVYTVLCSSNSWSVNNRDIPAVASATPSALGTAAIGSSAKYAKEDHVHETELAWFTYGTSTSAQIEAAYQAGKVCLMWPRSGSTRVAILSVRESATKHTFSSTTNENNAVYICDNNSWSTKTRNVIQLSTTTPSPLGTADVGNGSTAARSNHVHAMPSASDVGAVAVAQGVAHAGEFVVVGSDGNVTTVTLATWQGGSY